MSAYRYRVKKRRYDGLDFWCIVRWDFLMKDLGVLWFTGDWKTVLEIANALTVNELLDRGLQWIEAVEIPSPAIVAKRRARLEEQAWERLLESIEPILVDEP